MSVQIAVVSTHDNYNRCMGRSSVSRDDVIQQCDDSTIGRIAGYGSPKRPSAACLGLRQSHSYDGPLPT